LTDTFNLATLRKTPRQKADMSEPIQSYATYATQMTVDGPRDLQVKFFHPADQESPLPLLVWFHAGGFRTGDIESNGHTRIARNFAKSGYACAFVEYRLRARAEDLGAKTRALLPNLIQDAETHSANVNPDFIGARALAAVEDGGAFFDWLKTQHDTLNLNGHILLGGSSAGAMTVLNLLSLAPRLDIALPEIPTAIVLSGAFAYPSFFTPNKTRILAIHGTDEPQIPAASIRAYAYNKAANCTLIEDAAHQHGDPRITRAEPLRRAIRRFVDFDKGGKLKAGRSDMPERKTKRTNRICIYTCVKNEGPFLLEWIAHNRAIGVTDFAIFSNDCDDGTGAILDHLDHTGIIQHIINPSVALGSDQHLSLATHCAPYTQAFRNSDYAILTDVDEFIQINCADGTLNGLLATAGYPDVISLSELVYGFNGVEAFENRLVTSQFRASDTLTPAKDGPRRGVKSMTRIHRGVQSYSNHRPQIKPEALDSTTWLDGAGQPVPRDFITDGKRGLHPNGRYALGRVNHYTLRSGESMLVKFQRGDAVRPGRMREKYFHDRNGNDIKNDGFAPHLPRLKAELATLLEDPVLLRLHHACVAKHQAKITALKADPDFTGIWQAIREEVGQTTPDISPLTLVAE